MRRTPPDEPAPGPTNPADRAMGLELEANELEDELEWAEAQGRTEDAAALRVQLEKVIGEWSSAAEQATGTEPGPALLAS